MVEKLPSTSVVKIGDSYYITVLYPAGPKRLYITREQLQSIVDLGIATLEGDTPYMRDGKAIGRANGRYRALP